MSFIGLSNVIDIIIDTIFIYAFAYYNSTHVAHCVCICFPKHTRVDLDAMQTKHNTCLRCCRGPLWWKTSLHMPVKDQISKKPVLIALVEVEDTMKK